MERLPVDKKIRLEYHAHTMYSKDCLVKPVVLLAACRKRGLDRIVITDHNTTAGALHAQSLDPERVIVGEEIMTTEGELLAAYLTREIPPGLSAAETIQELRGQGAFISVSHPFDVTREGHWKLPALERIAPLVDAIEVFNSRCAFAAYNQQALDFARNHGLPGTVGSDAHTAWELGRAVLELPDFDGPESLRLVIRQAKFAETRRSPIWVRLSSRYSVIFKLVRRFWSPIR